MLAALPRSTVRCLRLTCRAARAAVDARLTALDTVNRRPPYTQHLLSLPAAAPRFARLRRLACRVECPAAAAALAAALPALPALTELALRLDESEDYLSLLQTERQIAQRKAPALAAALGPIELLAPADVVALTASLAAHSALRRLELLDGWWSPPTRAALLAAAARLPRLEAFRIEGGTSDSTEYRRGLELPWHQLKVR